MRAGFEGKARRKGGSLRGGACRGEGDGSVEVFGGAGAWIYADIV